MVDGPGYRVEWDSEGEGFARIAIKAAAGVAEEVAQDWLPENQWFVYEFRGVDAFERALRVALDEVWGPQRAPHRMP